MLMRNRDVISCLPLLASVLGNKYGVEIRIGGDTAKTNGKTIYLPSLPLNLDFEALELAKGYVDHESAHIRHTDFDAIKTANLKPPEKFIFNVIEDWRVENRLSDVFPGCRNNFSNLVKKVILKNSKAGSKNPALLPFDWILCRVRSWNVAEMHPELAKIRQEMDRHFPGLADAIQPILEKVKADCPDTKSAIAHAVMLNTILSQWQPEEKDKAKPGYNSSEPEAGGSANPTSEQQRDKTQGNQIEAGEGDQFDHETDKKEKTHDFGHVPFDNNPEGSLCQNPTEIKLDPVHTPSNEIPVETLKNLLSDPQAKFPENLGELLESKLTGMKSDNDETGIQVAVIGEKYITPMAVEDKLQCLKAGNALKQRLSGLLQSESLRKVAIGRRGKLHSGSLYRIYVENDRLFRRDSVTKSVSTAVHILIDCSFSMHGEAIKLASQACYAVARCLAAIPDTNPAVTAFPAFGLDNSVAPVVRHGKRSDSGFSLCACGDTPLASAVWWALGELLKLQEDRKIILLLTDGIPNSVSSAKAAISQCGKLGVEIYGIGMQCSLIEDLLPKRSKVIWKLEELCPAMFEILQQALTRGGQK